MSNHLRILEIDYSVSPGGVNMFEVYPTDIIIDPPYFESTDLMEAVNYCYNMGLDFEVKTLAQYYRNEEYEEMISKIGYVEPTLF